MQVFGGHAEGRKITVMKLKITTVGEAVLRQRARPLTPAEIHSPEIQ